MSPYLEHPPPDSSRNKSSDENIHLILTPLSIISEPSSSTSEETFSENDGSNSETDENRYLVPFVDEQRSYLPLEHNLKELLVKVSNTENLQTVTQIKLRVIARDLALQQLAFYVPALRELTLDGSIVFSLRDLGNGLKNLKILKVNRCQLPCIDGVLGFEDLEELYATDNEIQDLSPCAFLSNIRLLDVRRNKIKHLGSVSFLNLCIELKHLMLEGNEAVENCFGYRRMVKQMLPDLQMLDSLPFEENEVCSGPNENIVIEDLELNESESAATPETVIFTPRRRSSISRSNPLNSEATGRFIVRFPPKVCNGNIGKTPQ